jgi:hypothetical protein
MSGLPGYIGLTHMQEKFARVNVSVLVLEALPVSRGRKRGNPGTQPPLSIGLERYVFDSRVHMLYD